MSSPRSQIGGVPPTGRPILDLANALYLRSGWRLLALSTATQPPNEDHPPDRGNVGAEDSVERNYFRFAGLRFAVVFLAVFLAADFVFDLAAFFAMLPS